MCEIRKDNAWDVSMECVRCEIGMREMWKDNAWDVDMEWIQNNKWYY